MTARLHSSNGWRDARTFLGRAAKNPADGTVTLTLQTRDADRIPDAGPLLADPGDWTVVVQLRPDGSATGSPGPWQLKRVEPTAIGALKADLIRADLARSTVSKPVAKAPASVTASSPAIATATVPMTDANRPAIAPTSAPSGSALSAPHAPSTDPNVSQAASLPPTSALPAGAYALKEGRWVPLPANNGRVTQTYAESTTTKLLSQEMEPEAAAGTPSNLSTVKIARLTFDGRETAPSIPAERLVLVLVYVGPVTPVPSSAIARYPLLRTYPVIELAPVETNPQGLRTAYLYLVAPGFIGFGTTRVAVTIEPTKDNVTVLRASATPPPGRYALYCGKQAFEVLLQ